MPEDPRIELRRLRWRLLLCDARQAAQADGTGIDETLERLAEVWADVEPVGAGTFWNGQETDSPVTHRIYMRWVDYLDQTHAFLRATKRADDVRRYEQFRVRRVKELGGRKRFVLVEVELIKVDR